MSKYLPTIGLEIHVELATKTKMFCRCLNDSFEKKPNVNICPVCLAHPGVLPVINKKAVELVLKSGLALNSRIPEISKFDRKSYFYPDLPKGYQISQYDMPLCVGGYLEVSYAGRQIKIRRIHLEEDTARLLHGGQFGKNSSEDTRKELERYSLVDFNRAGVPLMELVTEPDVKNAKEAVAFAKELQLILRYLGISNADMEKGEMRIEANISLSQKSNLSTCGGPAAGGKSQNLGTKVEVKNLNSFKSLEEAIDYEIRRQTKILEEGEKIIQETRGWEESKSLTVSQRQKEEAHDYRYLPEPDLPILDFTTSDVVNLEKLKTEIPELPAQKRTRFSKEYGLMLDQIEILVEDRIFARYFEDSAFELLGEIKGTCPDFVEGESEKQKAINLLFNYFSSDLKGLMNEYGVKFGDLKITPENFGDLIALILTGQLSSRLAKNILKEMFLTGRAAFQIMEEQGLKQISDEKIIEQVLAEVVSENLKAIEDYRSGKENVMQFLVGQTMKKLKGRANPHILKKLLQDYLSR